MCIKTNRMSNRQLSHIPITGAQCTDETKLTERFSEQMAQLCMNEDFSDIYFIIDGIRIPAHRVILAARSEYFRALLYGGMAEATQSEIEMGVPLEAFKDLLKYIYSGHVPFSKMSEDTILDLLGLANLYSIAELELAISDYFRHYLSLDNVCSVLDASRLYNLNDLTKVCMNFMDRNASDILQHISFRSLAKDSLQEVLARDSFFASEVNIFLSVCSWCKHNGDLSVLSCVRLPLMSLEELLRVVRPKGIIDPDKLLDAIDEGMSAANLPFRGALWLEENVATPKFKARTIRGESRAALLDGDVKSYDMERGYTRHSITDTNNPGIVVELGTICIINHIKILLWDRDNRAYSYFIDVSVNQVDWHRVIDYTHYRCRSWQYLYFPARPVRYIKLVGTHNSVNKQVFHAVALEAMYTNINFPKLVNDIVVPTANVATVELSALVVDGVSRARNALLNGDYENYDWDSGYTCHQLGSGEIVVRLGQPYIISSIRLLLWDCDYRTYCYYIETSVDQKNWQMIIDRRNIQSKSWQNIAFTPHIVVFIKIVGTHNTSNEIFHCVHLECPSQDPNNMVVERACHPFQKKESSNNTVAGALPAIEAPLPQEENSDLPTPDMSDNEQQNDL